MLHREKFNYISKQEICMRHPSKDYRNYCELCKLPVCYHCRKHRKHKQQDIEIAYETKLQQHRETVNTIRSEALFYKHILLAGIKSDVKTCLTEFSLFQSKVLTKVQKVKDWIDYAIEDLMYNVFCSFDFKHGCLKQKIEMLRHLAFIQQFEHRYEQSVKVRYNFSWPPRSFDSPRCIVHSTPVRFPWLRRVTRGVWLSYWVELKS